MLVCLEAPDTARGSFPTIKAMTILGIDLMSLLINNPNQVICQTSIPCLKVVVSRWKPNQNREERNRIEHTALQPQPSFYASEVSLLYPLNIVRSS